MASASQSLAEYLQSPDDLLKVSTFRKKLEKEKASIDARLKSGVIEQLLATREGLRKLLSTRAGVQMVKDEMVAIERACEEPGGHSNVNPATFAQISAVSRVHRKFQQTEEMIQNLTQMGAQLDQLEDMLEEDCQDILGPAPNLLVIHFILRQLETFRNESMHEAKDGTAQSRATLARSFERLNTFSEAFEQYLIALAKNVLSLVRAGNSHVVVKLVKIAELEGREDEKAIAVRVLKKAAKLEAASRFKSMHANARAIKHYRSKFTRAITESIKAQFADAYADSASDPAGFLDGLQWMYQDIIRIERDVVPCFPEEYEIYSLYIREYHKSLNLTIKELVDSQPGPSVLLALFEWLKEYKASMRELSVPPDLLEPPLLDGKEQSLVEEYLQVIVRKLDEWSATMMKTELDEFIARREPPEVDPDGQYGPQGGAPIFFQIVNQQVDLAMESGQGAILARVVSESNRVMRGMQETWVRTLEAEFKKTIEKPEEAPGGFVEYLVALANDQIKSADYAEGVLARLEPLVSEKYRVTINERLNDAIDGYLDVAKKCTQTLIDTIFNDLKPATKLLFQAQWYDGIMPQIAETMKDYMSDYQSFLNPSLLELLIEDLLDAFLVIYLNALANSPKMKMPDASLVIRDDVAALFAFFSTLKPAKELEAYFEVIELILGILDASKDLVFLSFWSFAKIHGPNLAFVEGLVRARGDLDRAGANEVMDAIKRKIQDEGLVDPPEATIMKKVAVQGGFARFLRTT